MSARAFYDAYAETSALVSRFEQNALEKSAFAKTAEGEGLGAGLIGAADRFGGALVNGAKNVGTSVWNTVAPATQSAINWGTSAVNGIGNFASNNPVWTTGIVGAAALGGYMSHRNKQRQAEYLAMMNRGRGLGLGGKLAIGAGLAGAGAYAYNKLFNNNQNKRYY